MTTEQTKAIVTRFIEEAWNKQNLAVVDELVDSSYTDHSMPLPGVDGLKKWIAGTSAAFDHQTVIESQISEGDNVALRVRFRVLNHKGEWRGISPEGKAAETTGFRFYRVANGKIVEHWGHLDGDTLEKQLKD